METTEFDSTLGGTEHLPESINSLKFVISRNVEIAAMTESILRPSKTKLIFQCLPVHMRRRVMSHNTKRLPVKLRQGHLEQLKKGGLPPKQKRPSRKYRRRPANLLNEYVRRQRRNAWLETHIWHAKRFHMTERWGYRVAYASCDKSFRACYRATSAHCLIQDISYYIPVQITGPESTIKEMFSSMTSHLCGLGICAKAYTSGIREGTINLFKPGMFPFGFIGTVQFIWTSNDVSTKVLWLFVHPSQSKLIESTLSDVLCSNPVTNGHENVQKRRKLATNYSETIQIKFFHGMFNRFHLTGPNSQAVLSSSLKCIENSERIKTDKWICSMSKSKLFLKEKYEYWETIKSVSSPAQLSPKLVIGLVVSDPRLSRPNHRTKAKLDKYSEINTQDLIHTSSEISVSPLWNTSIHDVIKKEVKTNHQFIEHITKTQLVPGEVNFEDPEFQSVPVVLIQKPGSQNSNFKKLGYGSGWDIIVPSGYGLPFWHTFIMFGARAGGLREAQSLSFEMGKSYLSPDSDAGRDEEIRLGNELKEIYFRRPPSKRINYIKLGVNSPFLCQWEKLLGDWCNNVEKIEKFFVLRKRKLLLELQDCIVKKKTIPNIDNKFSCLVPIYLQIMDRGCLKRNALICLPTIDDFRNIKSLFEPHHIDLNDKARKEKRIAHLKNIKASRRRNRKLKKKGQLNMTKSIKKLKKSQKEPSEYVLAMRELWLPSKIENVRHSTSKEIMGYLSEGAFSFSEAKSCGVGYITYNGLSKLLSNKFNQVLVRNTSSRKYRLANIQIITE